MQERVAVYMAQLGLTAYTTQLGLTAYPAQLGLEIYTIQLGLTIYIAVGTDNSLYCVQLAFLGAM